MIIKEKVRRSRHLPLAEHAGGGLYLGVMVMKISGDEVSK
jgi:hypothetical protein